jgi:hypothetical protein
VPTDRLFERAPHMLELALAPDELRQSVPRRELKMVSERAEPDHLEHLDRRTEALTVIGLSPRNSK